jgi:hypothetical protein
MGWVTGNTWASTNPSQRVVSWTRHQTARGNTPSLGTFQTPTTNRRVLGTTLNCPRQARMQGQHPSPTPCILAPSLPNSIGSRHMPPSQSSSRGRSVSSSGAATASTLGSSPPKRRGCCLFSGEDIPRRQGHPRSSGDQPPPHRHPPHGARDAWRGGYPNLPSMRVDKRWSQDVGAAFGHVSLPCLLAPSPDSPSGQTHASISLTTVVGYDKILLLGLAPPCSQRIHALT